MRPGKWLLHHAPLEISCRLPDPLRSTTSLADPWISISPPGCQTQGVTITITITITITLRYGPLRGRTVTGPQPDAMMPSTMIRTTRHDASRQVAFASCAAGDQLPVVGSSEISSLTRRSMDLSIYPPPDSKPRHTHTHTHTTPNLGRFVFRNYGRDGCTVYSALASLVTPDGRPNPRPRP